MGVGGTARDGNAWWPALTNYATSAAEGKGG